MRVHAGLLAGLLFWLLALYWIVATDGLCYVAGWIVGLCVVVVLCLAVFGGRVRRFAV